jgi:myo-inositol-1(or 4)-monophosphatase
MEKMARFAGELAKEAGRISLERLKKPFDVTYKSSYSDLVTDVDKEVEKFVVNEILAHYPEHGILGEEGTFEKDLSKYETVWIIDPIDGTTNFVHQKQNYCVSIAVYHRKEGVLGVIYDPVRDELFSARKGDGAFLGKARLTIEPVYNLNEALVASSIFLNRRAKEIGLDKAAERLVRACRGLRIFGCAALELAYVACGRLDAYISLNLNPWDYAAGILLVEEAGGFIGRLSGKPIDPFMPSSIVSCNQGLAGSIMETFRG